MDDFGSPAVSTENDIVLVKIKGQVFKFLANKNKVKEEEYGLNFFSVISVLAANDIVPTVEANQQRHPDHKIAVIAMKVDTKPYLYEVPFLEEPPNIIFLKTFYPSRKMMHDIWEVPRTSKRLKKRLKKMLCATPDTEVVSVETASIAISISKGS